MEKKLKLSYTKLSFYLTCPKRYYYRYVEKKPFYPTMMTKYGSNIHRAIKDVSEIIRVSEVIDEKVQTELNEKYEKQWTDVSKDTVKNLELKELGQKQLNEFIEKNKVSIGETLYLEKSFNYPVDNLILNGYIDRIDRLNEGTVEIIDYKTGRIRPLYEDDIQLNFYALICRDYFELTPAKLSLYFLKTNEKVSVDCNNDCIETLQKLVFSTAGQILDEKFTPAKISADTCMDCCYSRSCPHSASKTIF